MAWTFFGLIMGLIALRLMVMAVSPRAIRVRPVNGKLQTCPMRKTCVSSQAEEQMQKVEPIYYNGPIEEAKVRLRMAVDRLPGTTVLADDKVYLHAEFESLVFGFMSDMEFLVDDNRKIIHVRSASRVGYSDMGANRRRVEAVRRLFKTMAA
ncbi:MAG TPA: DUF1499 domain-containing protein [Verrucomicrobiae bacterium]